MSVHTAKVQWHRSPDERFIDKRYSRSHHWSFDGGVSVPASSSPHAVPQPYSNPANVDPEEAFVAALSSCHMLTFLWVAAQDGYIVDSYVDEAEGQMSSIGNGREAVTRVTLRPSIVFSGERCPDDEVIAHLHHKAHELCFIANSVKSQIDVEGRWEHAP
jgi:organic hydroperoxide reductase OsmC/OhrA